MQVSRRWKEFQVLDSGAGEKVECWSEYILRRPEPQAIWPRQKKINENACYHRSSEGGGHWEMKGKLPKVWTLTYPSLAGDLHFQVSLMGFKHTGLFPEQAVNWDFMQAKILEAKKKEPQRKLRILNLFAYTGAASLACAKAGADEVVHVDASKKILEIAKENVRLSSLQNAYIRFLQDDVMKFIAREQRRGSFYDGIVMDPPAYGRGPSGELWQIEQSIFPLLENTIALLKENALFLVLSAYSNQLSPQTLKNIFHLSDLSKRKGRIEADEIGLVQENSDLILPCGYSVRWEA